MKVTAIGSENNNKNKEISSNTFKVKVNFVAQTTFVDATPTGLNNLPFDPSDFLNIGFSFEAKLDNGDIDSYYKVGDLLRAKNETFLIDDTNCVFYSRFSLFNSF